MHSNKAQITQIAQTPPITPFAWELANMPIAGLQMQPLTTQEQLELAQLIDEVMKAMFGGHSSLELKTSTKEQTIKSRVALLHKSGLCAFYDAHQLVNCHNDKPPELAAKPLTLFVNKKNQYLLLFTRYFYYEVHIAWKINQLNYDASDNQSQTRLNQTNSHQIKLHKLIALVAYNAKQAGLGFPNEEQIAAITNSASNGFSIITGGPGSGKTTTISLLLLVLAKLYDYPLKVRVCAQTGKAASRIAGDIHHAEAKLHHLFAECSTNNNNSLMKDTSSLLNLFAELSFSTIHKLLGYKPNSIYFKHNNTNKLDCDILIIDEASMVSLPLFYKLLLAIDKDTTKHVILLGDKNQLSSVEEGYVFASLIDHFNHDNAKPDLFDSNIVSTLNYSNRNIGQVAKLATLVLAAKVPEVWSLLQTPQMPPTLVNINTVMPLNNDTQQVSSSVSWYNINDLNAGILIDKLFSLATNASFMYYVNTIKQLSSQLTSKDSAANYSQYHTHKINIALELHSAYSNMLSLCFTNHGQYGVNNLNYMIDKRMQQLLFMQVEEDVAMVTTNGLTQNKQYNDADCNEQNQRFIWYTGKPIIILSNDYKLELYNGDIGICIVDCDAKPTIVFANGKSFVPEVLPNYQLAYAITIHKSQGSEYNHVALIIAQGSTMQNNDSQDHFSRELLYTGITRARNSVVIYASDLALEYAICNKTRRLSALDSLL